MSFIWSSLLYFLLLVPLLLWLYFRAQRQRREFAARFGSLGVVRSGTMNSSRRRHIPALIFLLGITVLITSAARPQATVSVPRLEGTVILTFDVSGSMAADDLKPTRMEAAKAAAREFVNTQPSNILIGVVAFSDGGISIQAPTNEREQTLDTIDRLVPRRGTSLGNGLLVALNTIVVSAGDPPLLNSNNLSDPALPTPSGLSQTSAGPEIQGWYPSAVIVALSDGENNQSPDPMLISDLAADFGVRVYTIGIGTPEGTVIEVEGFSIHSRLDEALLQSISANTGGQYYSAANQADLDRIYRDLEPKLSLRPENIEVTSLFAGAAFLLFLVAGAISLLWFGRVP
ncbi:MAG TPA: VWA domain-containing protein [Anaerolineales bacterium]|nr:VWA domain-containing protein [Anaerolineales bacterium]